MAAASNNSVTVRTPEAGRLRDLLLATADTQSPPRHPMNCRSTASPQKKSAPSPGRHRSPLRARCPAGITGRSLHESDPRRRRVPIHHRHRGGGGMTTTLAPPVPLTAARHRRVTQARVVPLGMDQVPLAAVRDLHPGARCALMIGLGALLSAVAVNRPAGMSPGSTSISTSLTGTFFAQLAVGVLGVLLISGEYSTGMIRSSLTVVPRRLPMLWGKLAVFRRSGVPHHALRFRRVVPDRSVDPERAPVGRLALRPGRAALGRRPDRARAGCVAPQHRCRHHPVRRSLLRLSRR